MSKNRTRTLLLSIMTLCIATAIVVGSTFALFTDTVLVNNHLAAGSLDVGLRQVTYQERVLGSNGLMVTGTLETRDVDLTASGKKIFSVEKAVPTSWYETTIEVSNIGSAAFDYTLKLLWNEDGKADAKEIAFAQQMEITVTSSKLAAPKVFRLSAAGEAENTIKLGYLLKNTGVDTFTVRAYFVDDTKVNNDAMLATLDFDLQINATQKTSLPQA